MGSNAASRQIVDFNRGWVFHLGDVPQAVKSDFDDGDWREVRLPHDWSVELSFTTNDAGGCTAFLPGGIGWYRKTFSVPESDRGRVVRIDFDGVYNNSDVWLNGEHLGRRPYGYSPFSYDLTGLLKYGEENTLVVKADRTAYMDCRWYPGSGIYRDVKLVTHEPVHIRQHGVFVTTEENRTVNVSVEVVNRIDEEQSVTATVKLQEADGQSAASASQEVTLAAGQSISVAQRFELDEAKLWGTENPYLYRAEVTLSSGKAQLDRAVVSFGIRDVRYDAEKGFFLNGVNTLIKGVCLHHDGGCVGAAVPDGVWERRLRILKEGGCNAIRTAHNPPSKAFLDLCDRMGFLVQDEAFDEWYNPKDKRHNFGQTVADDRTLGYSEQYGEWAEQDVKAMVLRDRNHPSIIMWSIGNEIEWTYKGYQSAAGYWEDTNEASYYWTLPPYGQEEIKERFAKADQGEHILAEQAADLARWIREEDTSRAVTANMVIPSVGHFSGYADPLDIIGYSYRTVLNEWGREHYPEKMIVGTENWVQWNEWKGVLDNPHIPGIFLWTGIDYLGESTDWPVRSNSSGMLNTAGFRKPNYWFFKTFWVENDPMVYIATQPLAESNYILQDEQVVENPDDPREKTWGWPDVVNHWNYETGQIVYVELYSNVEETELFLNEKSLGIRRLADCPDRLMKWAVPFEAGTLKAVGRNGSEEVASQSLVTAGPPVTLALTVDQTELTADGYDVAHCTVQLMDAEGRPVKHIEKPVHFSVEGSAFNIGVDNGSSSSTQNFKSDLCVTDQGRCLMVLQAGDQPGMIQVKASIEGAEAVVATLTQK